MLTPNYTNNNEKKYSYVSAPDVNGENLIFLVDVEDLYERHAVGHADSLGGVVDRSTNHTHLLVVVQQVLDESLFVGQNRVTANR